ncbi:Tetratricopeptide repeat-containing protein [Colwellia chukchiensis]|uniref:Tetratricopeptide repeat-containing protein n=1 Tax=Colwellia chukchiensis TaxID=641665 RepID=A0A1H7G8Y5_9GAMM|nr:sulfotransferase [Colwellia chukchiensis]SEK34609.1 Tetratricopeptide repeat-containing protein [Colwellia chukchiensis]
MADKSRYQSILALLNKQQFAEAYAPMKALVSDFPEQAEYWHLMSVILLALGQAAGAIECAEKALNLAENVPDYALQLASALAKGLQLSKAKTLANKVVDMPAKTAFHWDKLGTLFSAMSEHKKALKMYQQAVAMAPQRSDFLFNLATALRSNGDLKAAEQAYDQVININPTDYEAYNNRSHLRKQSPDNNHIDTLKALLTKRFDDWRDEVKICFALAKECEDIADYDASFAYLQRGCNLRRQHSNYNVDSELQAIDHIINTFSQQVIAASNSVSTTSEPIFILGLPRTGTTLVERIVGHHSQVVSAGELNHFSVNMIELVKDFARQQQPPIALDKLSLISNSIHIDFTQLAENYVRTVRPLIGDSQHFIDKLPLNYLYIGLIMMAFPNAKIIHLTREPMDACYAIYKTLFKDAYPFSYDFDDLARYYAAYQKLMAHWHQVLPGKILDVSYERLVENQAAESRKIMQYCQLAWQEQCLNFHENSQASTTASAAQIRQPIYNSSVEKWRHYQVQLQPLRELLRRQGVVC